MLVPALAKGPAANPAAKPIAKPRLTPRVRPPAKPIAKPQAAATKPPAPPTTKRPTAEPPPVTPPNLPQEEEMVALPLPPPKQPEPAAAVGEAAVAETAVARRRMAGLAFSSWLHKLWPTAEGHLPADATIPGKAERRIALQLAAVPAGAALVGLLPVLLGHANLLTAPPWALAAVFLAVLQLVYAAWMVNAPDWASARVQMVVCAVVATIYGMAMTKTMITPVNRPLILGLADVRRDAPAWCGLMFLLMGAATWFCGWTSARWKRSLMPRSEE